jgi:hypothetical protein
VTKHHGFHTKGTEFWLRHGMRETSKHVYK